MNLLASRLRLSKTQDDFHGAVNISELERLGLHPDQVLDFSANINSFGPAEAVLEAINRVKLDRYPDRDCLALRRALEGFVELPKELILPGNGASELIWLSALTFLRPTNRALVLGPTYCEYARSAKMMRARVTTYRASENEGFVIDPATAERRLHALRPRLAFICNPNNPTGTVLAPDLIAYWAREHPHTVFVVDEAYLPFAEGSESVIGASAANILVLRSMTKDFCLAGLRLGYAVGNAQLIDSLRRVQPPWSVNALAQVAGVSALGNLECRRDSLKRLAEAKRKLVRGLTDLGLAPMPSAVHFFLVPCDDPTNLRLALLKRGVLVRDCTSFGLPTYLRIATRGPEDNDRLLAVLREVI